MRSGPLLALAAFVSSVTANALASRPFTSRDVDTSSLTSGIAVDVCADISVNLEVPDLFHPGKDIVVGLLDICLCLSVVESFVGSNPVAIAGIALVGKVKVVAIITDLINKGKDHQQCHYPTHALPECRKGAPCCFNCKDGYTPFPEGNFPTQCICKPPFKECNGKCGPYHACPSGKAKRDVFMPRDRVCPSGLTACGVLGGRKSAWECVDTVSDLESCGGCMVPMHSGSNKSALGEDCSAITGVSDVSCVNSRCVVHRCRPGFRVSKDGSTCDYEESEDPAILAAEYGLRVIEHMPFWKN